MDVYLPFFSIFIQIIFVFSVKQQNNTVPILEFKVSVRHGGKGHPNLVTQVSLIL